MRMLRRWSMTGAGTGITFGVLAALMGYVAIQTWKAMTPGEDWIEIKNLYVEDAQPGEDPRIVYDRVLHHDTPGQWAVNVFRYEDEKDVIGTVYCSGSGVSTYKAGRALPPTATRLSWLMGREDRPCVLAKGVYRATITIIITPDGYQAKTIEKESNYFLVPPR